MPRSAAPLLLALLVPLAQAQRDVPRTYDLQDVKWSVTLDPVRHTISGDVTNTLTPLKPIGTVRFDCARLEVDGVVVNDKAVRFAQRDDALWITLDRDAKPGERLGVRVRYHGAPQAGLYFIDAARAYPARTPVVYTQGEMEDTRYWLPTYDFPDDKATSEGTIDVPKGWNVLSNGRLVEKRDHGDRTTFHWKMDLPHSTYLISLVAGRYTETLDGDRDTPVSYWVPEGLEDQGKATFGNTDDMIQTYEKLTGVKYPWPKFAQSAVPDFMFGGMENVSAVTQSISALHPARTEPQANSDGLVAHELAHQWFGDLVTCSDWSHIWINEGFASFMPAFVARRKHGEDQFALERFNSFQGGLDAGRSKKRPMIWNRYKDPMELFDGFAYAGGASRLFMLMRLVGEEKFWHGVHEFLETYKFRNASTEQFFTSMSKSTGVELDSFRKEWFETTGIPELKVSRTPGGFSIAQGEASFELPIEYAIIDAGKETVERGHVRLDGKSATIPASADALILIDPDVWLMADVRYDMALTAEQWLTMYHRAPNAGQKMRLWQDVLDATSEDQREALLRQETNEPMRQTIVRSLDNVELLCSLTSDPSAFVRDAAIQRLGDLPRSDRSVRLLRSIARDEANDTIRSSAFRSLASLTKDETVVEEAYQTIIFHDGLRIWALEWWREHKPDKARDLALSILAAPPNEAMRMAAVETLGIVKDRPGETRAFDALIKVVQEPTIGGVRAAISALVAYGDKRAVPFIRKLTEHSLHFVRNDAKEAVKGLGG